MNSPSATSSSPTFRNLKSKHKQSPVELKEKMRKSYKDKVQNCRNVLLNRFRRCSIEMDLHNKLTEIYKSMFNFPNDNTLDEEESVVLEEIKNELVQEEFEWWLQEHDRSQMDNIDWSAMEQDDNVICPVCQKTNLSLTNCNLSCGSCKSNIKTHKSFSDIKTTLVNSIEKHNAECSNDVQFTLMCDAHETHIYLICDSCMEMQCVV